MQQLSAPTDGTVQQLNVYTVGGVVQPAQILMLVVPKGKKHKPFADKEAKIMLIEPKGVTNTGDVSNDLTAKNDQWI